MVCDNAIQFRECRICISRRKNLPGDWPRSKPMLFRPPPRLLAASFSIAFNLEAAC
jgi:hypothetical protein